MVGMSGMCIVAGLHQSLSGERQDHAQEHHHYRVRERRRDGRAVVCVEGTGRQCPLQPHKGLAEGNALDLKEASLLEGFDLAIQGTDRYDDAKVADVVAITAGLPRQSGDVV